MVHGFGIARGAAFIWISWAVACGDPPSQMGPEEAEPAPIFHWVEAESLDGDWYFQTNVPPFSGRGFRVSRTALTGEGPPLMGQVRLSTGTYAVWARGYQDGSDRRFRLEVANTPGFEPTHGEVDGPGRYVWQRAGQFQVATEDPVSFWVHDAGLGYEVVDVLMFTRDLDFDPEVDRQVAWGDRLTSEAEWMEAALVLRVTDAVQNGVDTLTVPTDAETWTRQTQALAEDVERALGIDRLQPTALNARQLGEVAFDGYRVERWLYEAFPGFEVPALVYVPEDPGPHPAMMAPLSHGIGKSHPLAASRAHAFAQMGYVVLTFDPFNDEERRMGGNSHGYQPLLQLSGLTNAGVSVWETIRGLDFLLSREDVDPTLPVSMAGNSLGGLISLYAGAVDPRVEVLAPAGYVVGFPEFTGTHIQHDLCSYVFGAASLGGMRTLTAARAPRPQLILAGRWDRSFPAEGAQNVEAFARPYWEALGAPHRLDVFVGSGGHDLTLDLRERMYGFVEGFVRMGEDLGILSEPDMDLPPRIWVTEEGRVSDAVDVFELARRRAEAAVRALPSPDEMTKADLAEAISRVGGPWPEVQVTLHREADWETIYGGAFDVYQAELSDAVLRVAVRSRGPDAPVAVLLRNPVHDFGASLQTIYEAGFSVVAFNLRGLGGVPLRVGWYPPTLELAGTSMPKQWAADLVAVWNGVRQALSSSSDTPLGSWAVLLAEDRASALPALLAQAETQAFQALALPDLPSSLMDRFDDRPRLDQNLPNALLHGDLLHLLYAASEAGALRWTPTTDSARAYFPKAREVVAQRTEESPDESLSARLRWAQTQVP